MSPTTELPREAFYFIAMALSTFLLTGQCACFDLITMSFGFSVGDFITILQLASNIRKQFVDAPSQFKAIADE